MPAASVGREEERLTCCVTALNYIAAHRSRAAPKKPSHAQVFMAVEVKNTYYTVLLPSTWVAAELGDSFKKPQATSGPEGANEIAVQTKSKPDADERTEEGLVQKLNTVSDKRLQLPAEAVARCGFSKCTTVRCIYGSETSNVV